ncbi:MAG: alpha/beta hydrolase [Desulfobacterales bacterium]|nr:alpha/beta hydrolase [Desulfobacterales bacterium]
MKESIINIENDYIFLRHNETETDRLTLLFVHGLGESGLCFREVFEDKRFNEFNILVPDMIGHGKSSASADGDYSFDAQVKRIWKLLEICRVKNLVAIGHSLGGDLTTLLCTSDKTGMIKKYVSIEGDITQSDLFISYDAVEADKKRRFTDWLEYDFMNKKIYEQLGQKYISCRRYYASLFLCRPEAFWANAYELVERNNALPGKYKSEIGQLYCSVSIPKIFCYGTESITQNTLDFLKENDLQHKSFSGASHWLMIDKAEEFYSFLYSFLKLET